MNFTKALPMLLSKCKFAHAVEEVDDRLSGYSYTNICGDDNDDYTNNR